MIKRIGSNGWWLLKDIVEHLLSSLFPVVEHTNKAVPTMWAKFEDKSNDPQRPIEAFESWAGKCYEQEAA